MLLWSGGVDGRGGKKRTMASQLQARLADTCSFGTIFLDLDGKRMMSKFLSLASINTRLGCLMQLAGHLLRRLQAMFRIGFSLICIACIVFLSWWFWLFERLILIPWRRTNGWIMYNTCAIHTRSSVEVELELQAQDSCCSICFSSWL